MQNFFETIAKDLTKVYTLTERFREILCDKTNLMLEMIVFYIAVNKY
jgi:hypothetical protein